MSSRTACSSVHPLPGHAELGEHRRHAGGHLADGLDVFLWPMAHRFRRGHRIRLQISRGAHPCFGRNPGTGEPLATTGTDQLASEHEIFHDSDHRSAVRLPLTKETP
ncbi:CocE/NonD family hydrolase C-terminal non-catalytic domain-containing protein [Streptosporangium sp. G11]|uniref:CocE/NonD family hydrolase C-terminal non-catalytic domain-containing protein n=1 Tax=Streptosporangium sp. G11 TaxID=3436926 RepID=UPI003EBAF089